jgi:hypothetical protein
MNQQFHSAFKPLLLSKKSQEMGRSWTHLAAQADHAAPRVQADKAQRAHAAQSLESTDQASAKPPSGISPKPATQQTPCPQTSELRQLYSYRI